MTFSDNENFEAFVPVYDAIPDKWEDAQAFIVENFKKISNAVNIREIGWFLDEEVLSGKAFIPGVNNATGGTSQQFRQVLRKVIDFGPLPNAATKSVPHGITVDANFTLVQLYGGAYDPVAFVGIAIPHVSTVALANGVSITIDANFINITTGINRSSFTRTFIVVEYMQEL